ncbi:MAG: hypothetical protein JSV49_08575 [Thermoplasmata archaeon]|nr:MAG: hypothetical protein JSV49_08575 [Thermoplasmata archaeon]
MLEQALVNLMFISKNFDSLSEEELKEKLKVLERELRESILHLKKFQIEVLDNITEI